MKWMTFFQKHSKNSWNILSFAFNWSHPNLNLKERGNGERERMKQKVSVCEREKERERERKREGEREREREGDKVRGAPKPKQYVDFDLCQDVKAKKSLFLMHQMAFAKNNVRYQAISSTSHFAYLPFRQLALSPEW